MGGSGLETDVRFMRRALAAARRAGAPGEVPVGAVLVMDGTVVATGANRPISTHDPTAHAEIAALRLAARRLGNYRLVGATLYVTIEPCLMCVGALVHARVHRIVFGALEPKAGALCSTLSLDRLSVNHRMLVAGGILSDECGALVRQFFRARRSVTREARGVR